MRTFIIALLLSSAASTYAQRPVPSHRVVDKAPLNVGVVRVNGVVLSSQRLDAALNQLIPYESFHRSVSPQKAEELRRRAMDSIVNQELQYQEGRRLGVRVPDRRLQQEVTVVQRRYGTRAALLAALKQSGSTLQDLRQELSRTLTVDEVIRREVTAKCQVTSAEAAAFFAANPARFTVPEQVHVYGITVGVEPSASPEQWSQAKARAEELRRQIVAGAAFEEIARQHSTDPARASGGDMGFLHRGSMMEDFEQAISSIPLRQPSVVVQSIYGYHLLQVTEIRAPRSQSLADVAAGLKKDLTTKRCDERRDAWIAELRERSSIEMIGPKA
jgi:peptidyl-prolyl cis-trans isomerase C